ncbi:ArsR/SmtB family transcription factor [Granulicoccus phenolivorans]|uniref:ArsR/SmtB family transcription factor n=1 Tax=Granulicoccus phenolivorans TaxID=266854 RepID=UPI0004240D57|nr:metalloregulator ArsR/SmtB family transcription factor [Granulicoccus phenolivorans]
MGYGKEPLEHPGTETLELTEVLFALSDAARLDIVRRLADGPLDVAHCQPTDCEPLPKSTLSHHLKTLRLAGIIRNDPNGRQRIITLRRDDLEDRFPGLLPAVLAPAAPARGADRPPQS